MNKKVQKEESFFLGKLKNTWLSMQNHCAIKTLIWFSHFIRTYLIFAFVIICAYFVFDYYYDMFNHNPPSDKHEAWGQLGDYFGGILNPIIGLATIYLLSVSIRIQRTELKETRKELSETNKEMKTQTNNSNTQNFEQTFFTWLNNYSSLINSFNSYNGTGVIGIKSNCASSFIELEIYAHIFNQDPNKETSNQFFANVKKIWIEFYKGFHDQLDPPCKTLASLIRWIDSQDHLKETNKRFYIGIVLDQMSQAELQLFYFYGLFYDKKGLLSVCGKYDFFQAMIKDGVVLELFATHPELFATFIDSSASKVDES